MERTVRRVFGFLLFYATFMGLFGCAGPLVPDPNPSSCVQCPSGSVMCQTTLDDCIVQGKGCCAAGQLTLCSDGINSTWTDGNRSGSWSMHDRDIVLSGTEYVRLFYGGDICE